MLTVNKPLTTYCQHEQERKTLPMRMCFAAGCPIKCAVYCERRGYDRYGRPVSFFGKTYKTQRSSTGEVHFSMQRD